MHYVNTDSGGKLKMAYKNCVWGTCKIKRRNVDKSGKSVFQTTLWGCKTFKLEHIKVQHYVYS